jgi:hypothetical protein
MSKIIGFEKITTGEQLEKELASGGKFIIYQYVISVLILTFRRSSSIYFISGSQSRIIPGLGFSLLTLFLGWWGFPWGLIYTPMVLWINFSGGQDVTAEVLASMNAEI